MITLLALDFMALALLFGVLLLLGVLANRRGPKDVVRTRQTSTLARNGKGTQSGEIEAKGAPAPGAIYRSTHARPEGALALADRDGQGTSHPAGVVQPANLLRALPESGSKEIRNVDGRYRSRLDGQPACGVGYTAAREVIPGGRKGEVMSGAWVSGSNDAKYHVVRQDDCGVCIVVACGHPVFAPFHRRLGDEPPIDAERIPCPACLSAIEYQWPTWPVADPDDSPDTVDSDDVEQTVRIWWLHLTFTACPEWQGSSVESNLPAAA